MDCSQKLREDFAKFCGLLRIYELYQWEHKNLNFNNLEVQNNPFIDVSKSVTPLPKAIFLSNITVRNIFTEIT